MDSQEIKKELIKIATDEKTQLIRVGLDAAVIAPILIYAGFHKSLPTWLRVSLALIGMTTFFYNVNQYAKIRKMVNELKEQNGIK